MSQPFDETPPAGQPDPRVDLLRRALEISGVEPLVAESLAREHVGRITVRGRRFEVTDAEGRPDAVAQPHDDAILHLAERIKQSIPAKFLTDSD
jgi:hypothetical protein